MMKKFLVILAAILSSGLFMPVTFVAGFWSILETNCQLRQCKRTYTQEDIPAFNCTETQWGECYQKYRSRQLPNLPVAFYIPSEGDDIKTAIVYNIPSIKIDKPDLSFMLPMKKGLGSPGVSIKILSSTPTSQTISLHFNNTAFGYFMYETDGVTIKPIKSEIIATFSDPLLVFLPALLISSFLAKTVRRLAIRWRRRLDNPALP